MDPPGRCSGPPRRINGTETASRRQHSGRAGQGAHGTLLRGGARAVISCHPDGNRILTRANIGPGLAHQHMQRLASSMHCRMTAVQAVIPTSHHMLIPHASLVMCDTPTTTVMLLAYLSKSARTYSMGSLRACLAQHLRPATLQPLSAQHVPEATGHLLSHAAGATGPRSLPAAGPQEQLAEYGTLGLHAHASSMCSKHHITDAISPGPLVQPRSHSRWSSCRQCRTQTLTACSPTSGPPLFA